MRSTIYAWLSIANSVIYVIALISGGFTVFSLHFAVFGMGSSILSFLYGREGL